MNPASEVLGPEPGAPDTRACDYEEAHLDGTDHDSEVCGWQTYAEQGYEADPLDLQDEAEGRFI